MCRWRFIKEWTTKMLEMKEERAQASQRGMKWLEEQYVEAVLSIEYRCRDPYYYEYDGYDKDAAAILDLMLGCRLYRRRGFDSMEGYQEYLDRKVEQRRAEDKASEAESGCHVLTAEEFWQELREFQEL